MKAIVCVDNSLGIMFNKRRMSQDVNQRNDLFQLLNDEPLYMSAYSGSLYDVPHRNNIRISNAYHRECEDHYCLFEDDKINDYIQDIQELILYCWNRDYPSDKKLSLNFSKFNIKHEYEFTGSSHNTITRIIYERKKTIEAS